MSRTLTLRLDEPVCQLFKTVAERENRPISNFIETAVMRFLQEYESPCRLFYAADDEKRIVFILTTDDRKNAYR